MTLRALAASRAVTGAAPTDERSSMTSSGKRARDPNTIALTIPIQLSSKTRENVFGNRMFLNEGHPSHVVGVADH